MYITQRPTQGIRVTVGDGSTEQVADNRSEEENSDEGFESMSLGDRGNQASVGQRQRTVAIMTIVMAGFPIAELKEHYG